MNRDSIINDIIAKEGGYVHDPLDSGGETNFGITERVARRAGFTDPMVAMSRGQACGIYRVTYWDEFRGDAMLELNPHLAEKVMDISVNMGPARAGVFLQRSLNVLNKNGRLYPDIDIDGSIGPATLSAVAEYLAVRKAVPLVRALNCLQGAFYIGLAEKRPKDERFVYGWLTNRVGV